MDNPTSIKGLMQQMLPKGNDIVIEELGMSDAELLSIKKILHRSQLSLKDFPICTPENICIYWYLITAKSIMHWTGR